MVNAFLVYREYYRVNEQLSRVIHTHRVIALTGDFLGFMKDAETGQRGYLLTRRKEYLEPYESGIKSATTAFRNLKNLTSDNERQQKRLVLVHQLMNEKLDELADTITKVNEGDPDAALSIVNSDIGKDFMDQIRTIIHQFTAEEQSLLISRGEAERHSTPLWLLRLSAAASDNSVRPLGGILSSLRLGTAK